MVRSVLLWSVTMSDNNDMTNYRNGMQRTATNQKKSNAFRCDMLVARLNGWISGIIQRCVMRRPSTVPACCVGQYLAVDGVSVTRHRGSLNPWTAMCRPTSAALGAVIRTLPSAQIRACRNTRFTYLKLTFPNGANFQKATGNGATPKGVLEHTCKSQYHSGTVHETDKWHLFTCWFDCEQSSWAPLADFAY